MNYLAIRPTGNCKPAFADRETAFLEDFPLPRPDMLLLLLFKMRETVVSKNQKIEENMFKHILL